MGRPSDYNPQIADEICTRIISGESVRSIAALDQFPSQDTIYKWIIRHPEFAEKYARAREAQAELYLDEIIEIADETSRDTITITRGETETEVANNEWINRSRLRVDARKWAMSKLAPKKYGDTVALKHSGPEGGPIQCVTRSILEDK